MSSDIHQITFNFLLVNSTQSSEKWQLNPNAEYWKMTSASINVQFPIKQMCWKPKGELYRKRGGIDVREEHKNASKDFLHFWLVFWHFTEYFQSESIFHKKVCSDDQSSNTLTNPWATIITIHYFKTLFSSEVPWLCWSFNVTLFATQSSNPPSVSVR